MKILITGSHFTSAVSAIEELKKYPNTEIVYVGRMSTREGDKSKSIESREIPKLGVKFVSITTGRLQRAFTIYTIPSLFKIPIGFIQSFVILIKEKPDVVLSVGGYISVPLVVAAWFLSVPIIIHEQTLVSGLGNTISSWFADKIAISFSGNYSFDVKKLVLTGNPIRAEFTRGVNLTHTRGVLGRHLRLFGIARKEKLPVILVTGGNQGSHVINLAVEESLDKLRNIACVIHQTGDSKYMDYERLLHLQNGHYLVEKWVDNMVGVMKNVDLVVSRAGINTLSELAFLGIPALVIPAPYLYKNEQNENANFFRNLGLVRILQQNKLSSNSLLENIKKCLNDLNHLKKQAKKAKSVIIPDAAKRLALETLLLVKHR